MYSEITKLTSLSTRIGWLQVPIGWLGFLGWVALFPATEWVRENSAPTIADGLVGYVLGFSAAFAAWVVTHIYYGRYSNFIACQPVWKTISMLSLIIIVSFGFVILCINTFIDNTWQFNIGSIFGSFIMGSCFGPIINRNGYSDN